MPVAKEQVSADTQALVQAFIALDPRLFTDDDSQPTDLAQEMAVLQNVVFAPRHPENMSDSQRCKFLRGAFAGLTASRIGKAFHSCSKGAAVLKHATKNLDALESSVGSSTVLVDLVSKISAESTIPIQLESIKKLRDCRLRLHAEARMHTARHSQHRRTSAYVRAYIVE